jgi:hypothetical protein
MLFFINNDDWYIICLFASGVFLGKIFYSILCGFLKAVFIRKEKQKQGCGNERPKRKTLCQLEKGHKGSHQATIYWENE